MIEFSSCKEVERSVAPCDDELRKKIEKSEKNGKFLANPRSVKFKNGEVFNSNFENIYRKEYQMKRKFPDFTIIWVYITRLPSFPKTPEIAVPFAIENCLLEIQNGFTGQTGFGQIESTPKL